MLCTSSCEKEQGEVIFWENANSKCSGFTSVTIDGETNFISTSSDFSPECGSTDNATFKLPSGTYDYVAECSDGSTQSGTVTVKTHQCSPVQLSWTQVNPPPTSNQGQVVFWESAQSGCPSVTEVTINGVTKSISDFSASTPQCGSAGNATFNLAPGNYTYKAICDGSTKTGTVSLSSNRCTAIQLIWTSGSSNLGEIIFYNAMHGCPDVTSITINGVSKQITTGASYPSAPACGTAGNATFTLSPGVYNYTAKHCNTTNQGTVTVTANKCSSKALSWGFGLCVCYAEGQATFWTSKDFGCGTISVNIGGVVKTITQRYSSTPNCDATGCANFTLAPGTYSFKASCSSLNWSGNVTVTDKLCSTIQLTD